MASERLFTLGMHTHTHTFFVLSSHHTHLPIRVFCCYCWDSASLFRPGWPWTQKILLPVCQVPELNVYNHSGSEKRLLKRRKHSKCLYSALIRRDKGDFPINFSAIFKLFTPHNSYLQPFLVVFAFQPFPFLVVLVISLPFPIYQKQCKTIWCKTSMYLHVHKHFIYKTLN